MSDLQDSMWVVLGHWRRLKNPSLWRRGKASPSPFERGAGTLTYLSAPASLPSQSLDKII